MTLTLALPGLLDFDAARDLHTALSERRTEDLTIDGSGVTALGGLAAQVLVAAARDWRASGRSFVMIASRDLHDDLQRLGLIGEFTIKEATS